MAQWPVQACTSTSSVCFMSLNRALLREELWRTKYDMAQFIVSRLIAVYYLLFVMHFIHAFHSVRIQ